MPATALPSAATLKALAVLARCIGVVNRTDRTASRATSSGVIAGPEAHDGARLGDPDQERGSRDGAALLVDEAADRETVAGVRLQAVGRGEAVVRAVGRRAGLGHRARHVPGTAGSPANAGSRVTAAAAASGSTGWSNTMSKAVVAFARVPAVSGGRDRGGGRAARAGSRSGPA